MTAIETRYDKLNELWDATEAAFRRQAIPNDFWISLPHHPQDDTPAEEMFGVARHGGKWHLCRAQWWHDDELPTCLHPIAECSGHERIRCIDLIPTLWVKLTVVQAEFVKDADQAITKFEKIVAKLPRA